MKTSDLIVQWANEQRARGVLSRVIQSRTNRMAGMFEFLGAVDTSELDRDGINRWITAKADGWTDSTVNKAIDEVRLMCRFAVELGVLEKDPSASIKRRRMSRKQRGSRAMTLDEARRLVSTTALYERSGRSRYGKHARSVWYLLALTTGLRTNEIRQLRVSDFRVTAKHPVVRIRAEIAKNRSESRLPLRPETIEAVQRRVKEMGLAGEDLLFADFAVNNITWRRDCDRAGIDHRGGDLPLTIHGLRKTYSTLMANAGVATEPLAKLARHSTIEQTREAYIHADQMELAEWQKKLPSLSCADDQTCGEYDKMPADQDLDSDPEQGDDSDMRPDEFPVVDRDSGFTIRDRFRSTAQNARSWHDRPGSDSRLNRDQIGRLLDLCESQAQLIGRVTALLSHPRVGDAMPAGTRGGGFGMGADDDE